MCTHRANIIVDHPCELKVIGVITMEEFDLNGTFKFMPDFEETKDFPRDCENLKSFPISNLGHFLFTSLYPGFNIQEVFNEIQNRFIIFFLILIL